MEIVEQSRTSQPRASRRLLRGAAGAGLACALGVSLVATAGASPARPARHGHPGSGFGQRGDHRGLSGTVSGIASDGSSFTLAIGRKGLLQLTVDVTSTTTYSEAGSTGAVTIANLATGDRVSVAGSMTAANTVTATAVAIRPATSTTTPSVRVDGTVSATTTGGFTLTTGRAGLVQITVDVTSSTTYRTSGHEPRPYLPWTGSTTTTSTTSTTAPPPVGGVAVGDKVSVRGTVTGPNTLTATSVVIRSTGGVTMTGTVATVGTSSFTISRGRSSLVQITVNVSSSTTYAQLTGGPWRLEPPEGTTTTTSTSTTTTTAAPTTVDFSSIAKGDHVLVRGTVSGANTVDATMVVILPTLGFGHFFAQH
ncbi:MAG TPA: DUF5666 domain-containing protein [Acidimicrobiales bacterium]|nr:DUF5666 domain-containing protein [Acidimicrobiales bacterium]